MLEKKEEGDKKVVEEEEEKDKEEVEEEEEVVMEEDDEECLETSGEPPVSVYRMKRDKHKHVRKRPRPLNHSSLIIVKETPVRNFSKNVSRKSEKLVRFISC